MSIVKASSGLSRYRVAMPTSLMFDVIMPSDASDEEIVAQAAVAYRETIDEFGGNTLNLGLRDCRLYMYSEDGENPEGIAIED